MKALSGKPKRCKVCRSEFVPRQSFQSWCSPDCGLKLSQAKQSKERARVDKEERAEIRQAKERIKTKAQHAKEAQAVMNRYVRLRDAHLGCVSCEKPASWAGQWHCSHFRSVGAAPHIRFNLWNMNKSCSQCNSHLSGNLAGYRPALIEKIGQSRVDWLESNQEVARHDIPYLKRLKAVFAKKIRRIEKRIDGGVYGR